MLRIYHNSDFVKTIRQRLKATTFGYYILRIYDGSENFVLDPSLVSVQDPGKYFWQWDRSGILQDVLEKYEFNKNKFERFVILFQFFVP